jgi:hypothetical protein
LPFRFRRFCRFALVEHAACDIAADDAEDNPIMIFMPLILRGKSATADRPLSPPM